MQTVDFHGNSNKKETEHDGSVDQNVFDIQQGVSINIFVKTGIKKKDELGKVFHYDLYGKREFKYNYLFNNSLSTIPFSVLPNVAPNFFMVKKNFKVQEIYNQGFQITDLFPVSSVGIVSSRDFFVIDFDKTLLKERINDFFQTSSENIRNKYGLKEKSHWKIDNVRLAAGLYDSQFLQKISYKPFDVRYFSPIHI